VNRCRYLLGLVGPVSLGFVIVVWVVIANRMLPGATGDRGIYVSVAERLLAGDRLYTDVWDNKDPFFYYLLAATRWIHPLLDTVSDVVWVIAAGVAVFSLSNRLRVELRLGFMLSFGVAPIVLTGAMYSAGAQNLPATSLSVCALALVAREKFIWGGLLLGVVPFFRLTASPLALLLVVIALIAYRRIRPWLETLIAAGAVVVGGSLLLTTRGELHGYLTTLSLNSAYASSGAGGSRVSQLMEHVGLILGQSAEVTFAVVLIVALVAWRRLSNGFPTTTPTEVRVLIFQVGVGACAGSLILAFTGVWTHHGQLLYIPALLCLPLIGILLRHILVPVGAVTIAVLVLIALLLGGGTDPRVYLTGMITARQSLQDQSQVAPETAMILSVGNRGTYARAGQNDDGGHAHGLENWTLACPHFHQYPFFDSEESLSQLVECMTQVDAVIVAPSAREMDGEEVWNRHIVNLENMLANEFTCREVGRERICTNKR
jgi:hypothetical protein